MNEAKAGRVVSVVFSLLFLAMGAWIITMAARGETPAQTLGKPGAPAPLIVGVFGVMFCAIGLVGIVRALLSGRSYGPTVVAALAVVVCVLFGLCFLTTAILQPGEIVGKTSVNGAVVSQSKGHWIGVLVFSIIGVLPLLFARQIYRACKKTLEKNG